MDGKKALLDGVSRQWTTSPGVRPDRHCGYVVWLISG